MTKIQQDLEELKTVHLAKCKHYLSATYYDLCSFLFFVDEN